jgi:hypothetical protein
MPLTLEQVARGVRAEIDSDVNLEIVVQFVSRRIAELYSKSKFKSLRRLGELRLPAALGSIDGTNGGTCTVTPGSNIVTGDSTAQAAWSRQLEGRFFRTFPLHTWYRIAKCDPPTITLENPVSTERNPDFVVGTPLVGQAYYIVQRLVPAPPEVRYFGQFVLPYLYQPINFLSPEEMNRRYPARYLVGPYPWVISEFGTDFGRTGLPKLLEVYPYPLIDTIVSFTYWTQPPTFALTDALPPTLDPHIPRELAMIPLYRYEAARALRRGQIDVWKGFSNEARAQEAKFDDLVNDALKSDNGTDDVTFIMDHYPRRRAADWDPVQSAYADVWMRRG